MPTVVGVGCFAGSEVATPRALWRLRRRLNIVPSLRPGKYHRPECHAMGIRSPTQSAVEGDWLPGWGMMWKTDGGQSGAISRRLRRLRAGRGSRLLAAASEARTAADGAGGAIFAISPIPPGGRIPLARATWRSTTGITFTARPDGSYTARRAVVRLCVDGGYRVAMPSHSSVAIARCRRCGRLAVACERRAILLTRRQVAIIRDEREARDAAVLLGLRHPVGRRSVPSSGAQGLGRPRVHSTPMSCSNCTREYEVPACFAVVGSAALPGKPSVSRPRTEFGASTTPATRSPATRTGTNGCRRSAGRLCVRRCPQSKDALEQCIGAPVATFVPPYNQPFDYAPRGSISLAERREAGADRTGLGPLCEALRETGYRFCRVAYRPLHVRLAEYVLRRRLDFPEQPAGIARRDCVRLNTPCGFQLPVDQDAASVRETRRAGRGLRSPAFVA